MGSVYYKSKLVEYIKKNLKKGYPMDTLKVALVNQGYSRSIIEEAMKSAMDEMAKEAPTLKEKPQIEHEVVAEENVQVVPEKKSFFKKLFGSFKK
jgi:SOS response regulatory protein OraA/RecX